MTCKLFMLLATLALFPLRVSAQWSLGLSGGANVSFRTWEQHRRATESKNTPTAGWNAAFFTDWEYSAALAFRAETGFRLWRNNLKTYAANFTSVQAFDHVEETYQLWSVSCMIRLTPFSNRNFYLLTGPELSYFAKGLKYFYSLNLSFPIGTIPNGLIDPIPWVNFHAYGIRRLYYQLNVGAGMQIKFGRRSRLLLECRYQLGLENLSTKPESTGRMNAMQATVGYAWTLGAGKPRNNLQ